MTPDQLVSEWHADTYEYRDARARHRAGRAASAWA